MAREKMVTRTIEFTHVTLLCMNTETCEVSRETEILTYVSNDPEELLKVAQKLYQTDTFKIVKVEEYETFERLFGMTEQVFMENAIELDPTTRKPL